MRGRALEVLVHPFSFREALRHAGAEPQGRSRAWPKALRSRLEKSLRDYLVAGGFPEAQGVPARDRAALLRGYMPRRFPESRRKAAPTEMPRGKPRGS